MSLLLVVCTTIFSLSFAMRLLHLFLLLLALLTLASAVRTGRFSSSAVEELSSHSPNFLGASGWGKGLRAVLRRLRSKLLSTNLSETASRTSTLARAGSERFSVPQEDGFILYTGFNTPPSASTSPLRMDEGKRRDLGLWTKAKFTAEAARKSAGAEDLISLRLKRYLDVSIDVNTPRGRMRGGDGLSP